MARKHRDAQIVRIYFVDFPDKPLYVRCNSSAADHVTYSSKSAETSEEAAKSTNKDAAD